MGSVLPLETPLSQNEKPITFLSLLDRWLLLSGHGPQTRIHMVVAWLSLGTMAVVDVIWLSVSQLSFASENWNLIVRLLLFTAIPLGLCGLAAYRLGGAADRIGRLLRETGKRTELFALTILLFGLLAAVSIVWCYLAAAAALPFQDAFLARIDRSLGFDWTGFLQITNSSPLLSQVLVESYRSIAYMVFGTVFWLCLSGKSDRLAELLALMCLTFVIFAVGTVILPAEGAYAYHNPPLADYTNFGTDSGMWHHQLLMAIRGGVDRVVDFSAPNSNCLITFPSGHTVLGILTTYALRCSRWTLIPAFVINSMMLVSTIPHGGHYLIDVIAGAAISAFVIAVVRLPIGVRRPLLAGQSVARRFDPGLEIVN